MGYQNINTIICDDDKAIRNQIYSYLEEFEVGNYCRFEIKTFSSAEEMLKSAFIDDCELLFLDIEMSGLNGIEVSHIFREQQGKDELQIIFISAYDQYMKEMFDVRPFNFLSKPIHREKFDDTIERFIKLHKKSSLIFTYKVGRELLRVPYKEILYFESSKRKVLLHTKEGVAEFYGKLDELMDDLREHSFFRIHQSYLVNPIHIHNYSAHVIRLVNGIEIPISNKYRKVFLEMQMLQ